MTQNQIAFQQLNEAKRHNQEMEALGKSQQAVNISNAAMNPITKVISSAIPLAKYLIRGGK